MPYFCKEKDFAGRWSPVVYYERPVKSSQGSDPQRTELHEVHGPEFLGADLVSPNFKKLMETFS